MKFKTLALILFLILPASVMAQDGKPQALAPIRVSVATDAREDADWFEALVRSELNKHRGVIITDRKPDFSVYITATEMTEEGKRFGFAAALLVVVESEKANKYRLSLVTAPTLERVARLAIETVNLEHIQSRRR